MSAILFTERNQQGLRASRTPGTVDVERVQEIVLGKGLYLFHTDGVVAIDTKIPDVGAYVLSFDDEPREVAWPGGSLFVGNLTGSVCTLYLDPARDDHR